MRFGRFAIAIFCLVSSTLGPLAFAKRADFTHANQDQKSKVYAIVRVENDQVKCVQYAETVKGHSQIPVCASEGEEAAQNQAAMILAKSHGKVRTAFLSHLGTLLGGCIYGTIGAMAGVGLQSQGSENGMGDEIGALIGTVVATAPALMIATITTDPTGHATVAAASALVCGLGIAYLVYDERSLKRKN